MSHMLMRVDFLNTESTHKYVGEMMSKIRQWMGTLTWNPLRLGGQLQSVPREKTPACRTGVDRLWSASVVLQSCRMGKKGVFVQHQIGSHSAISHMKASEWLSFNRHLHSGINAEGKEQNRESTANLDLSFSLLIHVSCITRSLVTHKQTRLRMPVGVKSIALWLTLLWCARLHFSLGLASSTAAHNPFFFWVTHAAWTHLQSSAEQRQYHTACHVALAESQTLSVVGIWQFCFRIIRDDKIALCHLLASVADQKLFND